MVAAALYRASEDSYSHILSAVKHLSKEEKNRVLDHLIGKTGKFDSPLRELEHVTYTFDLVMDQGAYFEIKRHRMMTQTPQNLTSGLGYAIPTMFKEAGFYDDYCALMDNIEQKYRLMESAVSNAAAYIIPNGFNRRVLMTINFREAYHFCALRSAPNAHFSARRVAQRIAEEIRAVHPILGKYLMVNDEETSQSVERDHFLRI
jgi:thymidylate synthase ThyX